jgi:flagellar biosynthetic protein FliO
MSYGTDLAGTIANIVLALALVLTVLWCARRWSRNRLPGGYGAGKGRLVKVLASHYLGVKKSITVVQVPGSILVLGVGDSQINLLSRIEDPEVIEELRRENNRGGVLGFRDHLKRLTRCEINTDHSAKDEA